MLDFVHIDYMDRLFYNTSASHLHNLLLVTWICVPTTRAEVTLRIKQSVSR